MKGLLRLHIKRPLALKNLAEIHILGKLAEKVPKKHVIGMNFFAPAES